MTLCTRFLSVKSDRRRRAERSDAGFSTRESSQSDEQFQKSSGVWDTFGQFILNKTKTAVRAVKENYDTRSYERFSTDGLFVFLVWRDEIFNATPSASVRSTIGLVSRLFCHSSLLPTRIGPTSLKWLFWIASFLRGRGPLAHFNLNPSSINLHLKSLPIL